MALDTATKRRSMLAMGVLALVVHPIPDASIDAIDRKHFLGLMAAIATALPVGAFRAGLLVTPAFVCTLVASLAFNGELIISPAFTAELRVTNVPT